MLETTKLNPKSTRKIIRSVLPSAKVKSLATEDFIDKNKLLDQKAIAKFFKNFFCTIGKQVLDEDPPKLQNNQYQNYLPKRVSESIFFLTSPTSDEIVSTIHLLNVNKAIGHDNISAFFRRIAAVNVAPCMQSFFEFASFLNTAPAPKSFPLIKKRR